MVTMELSLKPEILSDGPIQSKLLPQQLKSLGSHNCLQCRLLIITRSKINLNQNM